MTPEEKAEEVKDRYSLQLLSQPGISGVGVEQDEAGRYVLMVHLDTNDPAVKQRLPTEIEGYPVKWVHSGPFRKFSED